MLFRFVGDNTVKRCADMWMLLYKGTAKLPGTIGEINLRVRV